MTLVSRKLRDYFRRRDVNLRKVYTDMMTAFDYFSAAQIAREAMDLFLEGQVQEVWLYYTQFINMGSQKPTLVKAPAHCSGRSRGSRTRWARNICANPVLTAS